MAEQLVHKKRIRAGHRSSATKMLGQVYEALGEAEINLAKLRQQRAALEKNVGTLQGLDREVLDALVEEAEIVEEIEQSDAWRGKLQLAIVELETAILDKLSADLPSSRISEECEIEPDDSHGLIHTPSVPGSHPIPSSSPPGSPPGRRAPRVKLP